ncbi:MAG: hypothetical protein JNN11_01485 [Candidatus Doudnabacteria bacterium]|nr:hypothetical protein [Candidatus Doudnabacteria bacterium]
MKKSPGYIMVTSVIMASILLVGVSVSLSSLNYFNSSEVLNFELKKQSAQLAESCAQVVLAKIRESPQYAVAIEGECIEIGEGSCRVMSVEAQSAQVQVLFNRAYTNLNVGLGSDLSIDSLREIPTILATQCE